MTIEEINTLIAEAQQHLRERIAQRDDYQREVEYARDELNRLRDKKTQLLEDTIQSVAHSCGDCANNEGEE